MDKLPIHIAVIMDGNGRWAEKRKLARLEGHRAGSTNVIRMIQACSERGIEILTLFAFSTQNWNRPTEEVLGLLYLFGSCLDKYIKKLLVLNIRVRVIGDLGRFHSTLYTKVKKAEELTRNKTGLILIIALGYGGQWDIVEATKKVAQQVSDGHLKVDDITIEQFSQQLELYTLPAPDLCIRTGGEYRISNFLLWHLAYSELYFTTTLWPDFNESSLDEAIKAYNHRERRFGVL